MKPGAIVLTPQGFEARALRRGAPELAVVRTGPGSRRAIAAARTLAAGHLEALTGGGDPPAAIAVAGLACGLEAGLAPGTVVVADRVLDDLGQEVLSIDSAGILAGELRRRGETVVVGPVISVLNLVDPRRGGGEQRSALARTGALAVDTETAFVYDALARAEWRGSAAVIRVVCDVHPDGHERPPSAAWAGRAALKALRRSSPVLSAWGSSLRRRQVLLAGPRSFCAGVERAISTVERALEKTDGPVYVRRQIVHNHHVVKDLEARGAVFVEELDQVPDGATVILSAHGVSPKVRAEADGRDLSVIDATCPLVAKVHHEVRRFTQKGYQLVLIGHDGHDETEGTRGESDDLTLVSTPDEVDRLDVRDPERLAYITQTTLSPDDVAGVVSRLSERFPAIVGPHAADICYATQNRQDAVAAMAADCDRVLVIGSANSSNAARLVEVAARSGAEAVLVEDDTEIPLDWVKVRSVGVTAAASTPPQLVERVVAALAALGGAEIEERITRTESVNFPLPVEVR